MSKEDLIRKFEDIAKRRQIAFDGLYYNDSDKSSGKAFGYDFYEGVYLCLGGFKTAKRGYLMTDAI